MENGGLGRNWHRSAGYWPFTFGRGNWWGCLARTILHPMMTTHAMMIYMASYRLLVFKSLVGAVLSNGKCVFFDLTLKIRKLEQSAHAIETAVQRQPGTNTVAVTDSIKELLPSFRTKLPGSMKLEILYDRSESIRESMEDVNFTLYLSIALVVMVIFIFLRNVSATLIPALALPVSIIATFAVMHVLRLQPG